MKSKRTKPLPTDDPMIAAAVERALEPYKSLYSPAKIAQYREEMRLLLTGHPYAIALANQARPRLVLAESGTIPSGPFAPVSAEEESMRSSGRGNGPGAS